MCNASICIRLLATALLSACSVGTAMGQATAPVTNQRHTHHHNDKHPVVHDQTLIYTNRKGAELDLPTDEPMFTFAVFGDRTGGPNEGIDVLADAVADANLYEPDLVMTVGDLVEGYTGKAQWLKQMEQYKAVMDELRCPWMPVAGNHDVYWRGEGKRPRGENEQLYEMHFGPLWYAFEHKNCWFIVLYSDEGDPDTDRKTFTRPEAQKMSDEQFQWLKGILKKASDAQHVFLFLHHPRWNGGNYGDDWEKVHRALVEAGNVSIVFAGHIHHMTYDQRDGIEYVTLATVGGHQTWRAPEAGYLHQFDLVTVRRNQIALASIPVGQTMDVREVTREVSRMAAALADVKPAIDAPIEVADDGSALATFSVTVQNPVDAPIEIEVAPQSDDSRWIASPDHYHGKLSPHESRAFTFQAVRPAGSLDDYARSLEVSLSIDLLADNARFSIPTETVTVPGSVALPQPAEPEHEMALWLNGNRGAGAIDAALLGLHQGPFTFECRAMIEKVTDRAGLLAAPGFGIWLDKGTPVGFVYADGKWIDAHMPQDQPLKPGKAYHLAGVFDGNRLRLYVDGKLVANVPVEGAIKFQGDPVTIGADTTPGGEVNTMPGWVDEVRVSDVARYQGESFTPELRHVTDEHTMLLLHMDREQNGYLYDASGRKAHVKLRPPAEVRQAE